MQLADLICVCVLILTVFFGPDEKNPGRFPMAFLALCVLALNRFSCMPYPELNINFAALVLPLALCILALQAGSRMGAAICLGAVSGLCGMLYEAMLGDVLLVTALMALTSAALAFALGRGDAKAYSITALSPLFTALLISAKFGMGLGYSTVDTAAEYVLDAQVLGMALLYILVSIKSFLKEKATGLS